MITYEILQSYWWFLISVLGGILVFMLFVQGGQTLIHLEREPHRRSILLNATGRKWELTFTTLVVFGGAFFASFPLFYSTSFGGAYWLWMLILIGFVLQAVSYEYRRKKGNIYGTAVYDTFLVLNGTISTILLGVAVGMFFFGAEFTIDKSNITNLQSPAISSWSDTHGLEAILNWKNLLLGFTILFLARIQALLYFIKTIDDSEIREKSRESLVLNGLIFVILFITFLVVLLSNEGCYVKNGNFLTEEFRYLINFMDMWWYAVIFFAGVILVLLAIIKSYYITYFHNGIWLSGIGTFLVVISLFGVVGYNDTAYYHSLLDINSSLTIRNSSSSEFTLTVMSCVSLIIPFVMAYIIYSWRALSKNPITEKELEQSSHKY